MDRFVASRRSVARYQRPHGGDDPRDVGVRERGVERQADTPREVSLRLGTHPVVRAVGLAVPGLCVDRDVVHLRAHARGGEAGHDGRAITPERGEVHPDDVQMEATVDPRAFHQGGEPRQPGEGGVVGGDDGPPPRLERIELDELRASERALQVGDAVVEAEPLLLVVPRPRVRREARL